ncbi:MAG: hypothetical protein V3V11_07905 [Vicinamibacteria bacterium]
MNVNNHWNITVSKECAISSGQLIHEITEAIPTNGEVVAHDAGESWVISVPSQIETKSEVEQKLLEA